MNNPLSAKIRHLDCLFRTTALYDFIAERAITKGLYPPLTTLFVPISLQSTKSMLDHTILFLVTKKKNSNYRNLSAHIRVQGSHNFKSYVGCFSYAKGIAVISLLHNSDVTCYVTIATYMWWMLP